MQIESGPRHFVLYNEVSVKGGPLYSSFVWDQLTKDLESKVETTQNVGMRIILNAPRMATGTEMRQKLGWCTLANTPQMLAASALDDCTVVNCT